MITTNYRIVIETEASGKKWYYIQERVLLFFWCYLRKVRDMSMRSYKIGWQSLEEAEAHLQLEVNKKRKYADSKIIKREYFYYVK